MAPASLYRRHVVRIDLPGGPLPERVVQGGEVSVLHLFAAVQLQRCDRLEYQRTPPFFVRGGQRLQLGRFQFFPRAAKRLFHCILAGLEPELFADFGVDCADGRPRAQKSAAYIEEHRPDHWSTSSFSATGDRPTRKPSRANASPTRNNEPVMTIVSVLV